MTEKKTDTTFAPYFTNVLEFGDLAIEQVLVDYNTYPVLFVLVNEVGDKFICSCCEIREEQRWIIGRITTAHLIAMLRNQIPLKAAFLLDNQELIIGTRNYMKKQESFKKVSRENMMNSLDLPSQSEYFDDLESQKAYVQMLVETKRKPLHSAEET